MYHIWTDIYACMNMHVGVYVYVCTRIHKPKPLQHHWYLSQWLHTYTHIHTHTHVDTKILREKLLYAIHHCSDIHTWIKDYPHTYTYTHVDTQILREKLLYAIHHCSAIDTDQNIDPSVGAALIDNEVAADSELEYIDDTEATQDASLQASEMFLSTDVTGEGVFEHACLCILSDCMHKCFKCLSLSPCVYWVTARAHHKLQTSHICEPGAYNHWATHLTFVCMQQPTYTKSSATVSTIQLHKACLVEP